MFSKSHNNLDLYIDRYGNLYFDFNNTVYEIEIDRFNVPNLSIINLDSLKNIDDYKLDNINNYIEDSEENDEYKDTETSDDFMIDDDNINKFGYNNLPFNFYSNTDSTIKIIDGSDICALYDTYIYDNDQIIFISSSKNNDSIYKLQLHNDGKIVFTNVGEEGKNYKIFINADSLGISVC